MMRRLAVIVTLAAGLLNHGIARAQPAAAPVPDPLGAAAAYEDRLIEGGVLAPDSSDESGAPYNPEGWPRYWRIEGVASSFDQQGQVTRENGFRLSGRVDTPQYGALSVDATARIGSGSSFIATLVQRDMGFDGNWRTNNSLGVVTTLGIDLSRNQYRFFVPTFAALGGTTEWLRDGDLQLQASAGEPGNYDGLRLSGFQSLHGSMATAGAQWAFSPGWQAGVQLIETRGVSSPFRPSGAPSIDSQSAFAAIACKRDTTVLQLNVLASDASSEGPSTRANGVWFDGRTVWDRTTQHYGIFRLEPGLTWGYEPINNDVEGGYYRFNYQSLRWQVDGGIDRATSISGHGSEGTYVTLNGRYQLTSRFGLGGNGAYLHGNASDSWSSSVFADLSWSLGQSHVGLSTAQSHTAPRTRGEQVELSHNWNTPAGVWLTTSLTGTSDTSDATGSLSDGSLMAGKTVRQLSIGVLGGGAIANNLSLDANLQYNVVRSGGTASGVYGNLSVNWRISSQWSLIATYYDNYDNTAKLFALESPITTLNPLPAQHSRAYTLALRYEDHAGTPVVPIGGRPGSAAGSIAGLLYLDSNDNGQRDPGEPGAANVTVLLDGRFYARTDQSGRFEFPLVAVGVHTITIVPDNLPLPWAVAEPKFEVLVSARSTSNLEIGARRLR